MNKDNFRVGDKVAAKPSCTVSLTPYKKYVVEMVTNDGIGITDDRGRQHLFHYECIRKHLSRVVLEFT